MAAPKTRDWYAVLDMMPMNPGRFYVTGEVEVPNPGVEAFLLPRQNQGINPAILLLDLYVSQRPGTWPQVVVWVPTRYDKQLPKGTKYTDVEIFFEGTSIAKVKVQEVS